MVTVYGMNEKVGNVSFYDPQQDNMFTKPFSEETGKMIDEEVRKLIENGFCENKRITHTKEKRSRNYSERIVEKRSTCFKVMSKN